MVGVVLCWKQSSILQASHEASPPLEDSQLERCRLGTWASRERMQCFCIQFKFWSKIEAPKLTRLLWNFHELDLHLEMPSHKLYIATHEMSTRTWQRPTTSGRKVKKPSGRWFLVVLESWFEWKQFSTTICKEQKEQRPWRSARREVATFLNDLSQSWW